MVSAVANGDQGKVYKLFREGASPLAVDPNGEPLLSRALQNGHAMTALIIVKAGGDPTDDGVPKTTDEPKAAAVGAAAGASGVASLHTSPAPRLYTYAAPAPLVASGAPTTTGALDTATLVP